MTKRGLFTIIIILILLNGITLLYLTKKDNQTVSPPKDINEINENEENLSDKNVTSADDPVASFQAEEISYREWINSLRETYGKDHLESMILERVVNQFADQGNFKVNEKAIEREISFLTTMSGILTDEELAERKKEWAAQLHYQQKLAALLTKDIHISEEEAQSHYEAYKNQYNFSASFQLSHIVVADMVTAEKIISELEQGAEFSLLAEEYTLDEDTKNKGGYLGYFTKGNQFVPYGYESLISNLSEQSYSDPVSLGNQVVIVYLHRNLPEINFTYDEIKDEIMRELAMKRIDRTQRIQEVLDELTIDWIFAD